MNDETRKLREVLREMTPAQRERLRQSAEVELLKRKLEQAIEEQHAEFGPPSPFDYDTVEGSHEGRRVFFYRHRSTGAVIYPPSHPRYAG